jgi:hypothetical protein
MPFIRFSQRVRCRPDESPNRSESQLIADSKSAANTARRKDAGPLYSL